MKAPEPRIPAPLMERYEMIRQGGRKLGLSGRKLRRWTWKEFRKYPEYDKFKALMKATKLEEL